MSPDDADAATADDNPAADDDPADEPAEDSADEAVDDASGPDDIAAADGDDEEKEDATGRPESASRAGGTVAFLALFLPGLGLLVIGAIAFLADVATGHDILRSLVATSVGAGGLIAWAGYDSYTDPESGVETLGGAVGTGLILLGLFLLGAGLVVALTGFVHGRFVLGAALFGAGVPVVLGGFLVLPVGSLPTSDSSPDDGETVPADGDE